MGWIGAILARRSQLPSTPGRVLRRRAAPPAGRALRRAGILAAALVLVATSTASGAVWTDRPDYAPGAVVTISGANDGSGAPGYVPGNTVNVAVAGPNGWAASCGATVEGDGAWSCQVTLSSDPAVAVGDYTYVATSIDASGNAISESGTFADTITYLDILAPVRLAPATLTALPANVTITFDWALTYDLAFSTIYIAIRAGSCYLGTDIAFGAFNPLMAHYPNPVPYGTDSMTLAIPAGTANGAYAVCLSNNQTFYYGMPWVNAVEYDAVVVALDKADQPTLTVTGPSGGTYGHSYPISTAGGAGTGALTFDVGASTGCQINSSDATQVDITSGTGACTITATKAGDGSYNAASSAPFDVAVSKADATCTIEGYTGPYDTLPHGATGSCMGVNGVDVGGVDLGAQFVYVPGGTALWSFHDPLGNYADQEGGVEIVISPIDADCSSIHGWSGQYDGAPHGATGTCTGAGGDSPGDLNLGAEFTNPPGGTAHWTLTGNDNYTDQEGDVAITINRKQLTVTADDRSVQYSDLTPDLTFTYAGFAGLEGASAIDTPPTCSTERHPEHPASTFPITCAGGVDDNYSFSYVDGTLTVQRELATVGFDSDNPAGLEVSSPGGPLNVDGLHLVVTVVERTPDLLSDLAAAGDVGNAGLTVILTSITSGGSGIELTCTPEMSGTGYAGVMTFTCTNDEPLVVDAYDVSAEVTGDYYVGSAFDAFTVYDPSLGFATGGGKFTLEGDSVNFGFVMKYNKTGTSLKGSLIAVRHHPDGTVSRIKSNALGNLALQNANSCGIAKFDGKATYTAWDAALNGTGGYVTTGGNVFSVQANDCNQPGTGADSIWIRGPGEFYMGATSNGNTQTLTGGNVAVRHTLGKK